MKRLSTQRQSKARLNTSVDLDEIFNGGSFQLDKGDDFECAAGSAAQVIRAAYRQRYGHLTIKESADKNSLIVTVVPGRQA